MLKVTKLCAGYGRIPILNAIDFNVEANEFVGVLGHNGVGKTTLLRTIAGFVPATSGSVAFDEKDVTSAPPHLRAQLGIGYVPQGRQIFPGLSVLENLRMGCVKERGDDRAVIATVLEDFPRLKPLLDRAGGALSGGEQQLLAMARCLCGKPRLLLLDEPTEGIQPSIIDEIVATLQKLQGKSGLTMILVEQNLDFISALSKRVLVIQKGAITRQLQQSELSDSALIGEFIGISNERDAKREGIPS